MRPHPCGIPELGDHFRGLGRATTAKLQAQRAHSCLRWVSCILLIPHTLVFLCVVCGVCVCVVCVSQYVSMCNRCTLLLFVRVDTEHMHVYRERERARAHTHTHTHKTDRGASRLLKGGIIAKNSALKHGQKATDVLRMQILSCGGVTDSAELGVVTHTLNRVLRQAKVLAT